MEPEWMGPLTEEQFQAVARALADPRRFAILEQIAAVAAMACSTLREQQIISPATISHHVKELNEAGLIRIEREGRGANLILCQPVLDAYMARLGRLAPGTKRRTKKPASLAEQAAD